LSKSSTDHVTVGRVGRPHGLDGSFFVERASEDPERFAKGATLYVGGEPAKVATSKRGSGGRPVIKLDRAVPRGADLTLPRDELPATEEGEYYTFELIGLDVEDESGAALGSVKEVISGVANDVLELDSGLALPLVDSCVRQVDLGSRKIVIAAGFVEPPLR
jgi:16S rRNA processing protein RimM